MARLSFFELQTKEPHGLAIASQKHSALITDDLLIVNQRIVRWSIPDWTNILFNYLASYYKSLNEPTPNYLMKSGCFNQLGLVESYLGRTKLALDSCYAHLDWVEKLAATTGHLELIVQGLEPWINLGRIDYLTGRYEAAVQRFALLPQIKTHSPLDLGAFTITPHHWEAITQARPDLDEYIDAVFIMDSIKALLKGKDYQAVLDFAAQNMQSVGLFLQDFLTEAKLVALSRLERANEALELAQTFGLKGIILHRLIFQLHKAEILLYLEEEDAALNQVNGLAFATTYLRLEQKPTLNKLFLVARLVKVLKALNELTQAQQLAEKGYIGAAILQDETLKLEFLSRLVELNAELDLRSDASKDYWQHFKDLTETTCYKGLRAKAAQLVGPCTPLEETKEYRTAVNQLDGFFQALTKEDDLPCSK